jgi:electron transport complex, RnfABCDGE type, G subunit
MQKLESTLRNMLLSLTLVCVVSGGMLATAYILTKEAIAEVQSKSLQKAIMNVVPEFDNDPVAEAYLEPTGNGDSLLIYPVMSKGEKIGAAVESYSNNGFSGEIRIIVGFDNQGVILNYAILSHSETPGLGSKMADWFKAEKNNQNIIGRSLSKGALTVKNDGGEIDGITASTITSRAFLEAVNRAYNVLTMNLDGETGASPQTEE